MPRTPAWPPASRIRLFVEPPLATGQSLTLDGGKAHYLLQVMRVKPGEGVMLFDDLGGEWLAQVESLGKRTVTLVCAVHVRPREAVPDLWLAAAPIRRSRYDWVAEKACELGVARLIPVLTRRSVVDKAKPDRLRSIMIEAAEQCGRTALPEVAEGIALGDWLRTLGTRRLFFADENLAGVPGAPDLLMATGTAPGPAAILIGPEGGFDPEEARAIAQVPGAIAFSLGERILRADTAALAAVTLWMAAQGERGGNQGFWRRGPLAHFQAE